MDDLDLIELEKKKASLIAGMTNYMNAPIANFDPGYNEADIQKCDAILRGFIGSLQQLGTAAAEPEILRCIEDAVLDLNKLNESVGGGLIETDQREGLCDYILFAAGRSGLKIKEDVTEEWREW